MSPLRLFGIAAVDGDGGASLAPGTMTIAVRDLGAIVAEGEFDREAAVEVTALDEHREIVDAAFQERAVLPAPPGTVFRTREGLVSWLELHYAALHEGLVFVEGRAVARLHFRTAAVDPEEEADAATAATEAFRSLRRHAVAAVPIKTTQQDPPVALSAAFLVARDRWDEFTEAIREETRRRPDLDVTMSGPWPPYDFVRMQLGG